MDVILLGTGTPTNPRRFQTAVLLKAAGDLLLFDAGRGTVHQMYQAGVDIKKLHTVFITHHHFDHINDLFDVIVSSAMQGREHTLRIYGPPGTREIVEALLNVVYARDIRFRLQEQQEIHRRGGHWQERAEAISDVHVEDIMGGHIVQAADWRVVAEEVKHGDFPDAPDFNWHCLGYRVEAENKTLAISGDAVPCEGLIRLARNADLLIQCCHFPRRLVDTPVRRYLTESILPSTAQVGKVAAQSGAKRMVLTHLSQWMDQVDVSEIYDDIRQDFEGSVQLGQDLMHIHV